MPLSEAVPTWLPKGCGGPRWFSQTMISAPSGWPMVVALRLNQMSSAASHCPVVLGVMLQNAFAVPMFVTCSGRPLLFVQFPQWQPLKMDGYDAGRSEEETSELQSRVE